MENHPEEHASDASAPKRRLLRYVLIGVFFALPVLFVVYKTSPLGRHHDPPAAQPVAPPAPTNAVLEDTVRANPSYQNVINLSLAYINQNQSGKAVPLLEELLTSNPQSAVAHNNLSVAYTLLGRFQDGIDAAARALQIDGSFQLARNNLNWATAERDTALAAIEAQERESRGAASATYYIDYGLNYFHVGRYDKSIVAWNQALALEPKNSVAMNNIGSALLIKKQYDDAAAMFQKALEADPTNQLAKDNLERAQNEKTKMAVRTP